MNKEKFKKIAFFLLKRLLIYSALIISIPLLLGYIFMEKLLLPEVKTADRNGNTVIFSNNFELDAFFHPPRPGKDIILYNPLIFEKSTLRAAARNFSAEP